MSNKILHIDGMTCQACVSHIKQALEQLPQVAQADVSLETGQAVLSLQAQAPLEVFQEAIGAKYKLVDAETRGGGVLQKTDSKIKQLRPLLVIFVCLLAATAVLNFKDWNLSQAMLDFMGLFFLFFGLFKIIDLKGFPGSFSMYDPLAAHISLYGWIYPFIELAMGALLMLRLAVTPVLFLTVVLLSITTVGIVNSLLSKRKIRCACLGTWLNLPMTEATLIENAIMILMAIYMLTQTAGL